MSLSLADVRRSLIATTPEPEAPSAAIRIGGVLLPLLLITLWTVAVRLPFYKYTDTDEFFLSVIAEQWRAGGLPYVATFDLKPPGLFFLYLVAQSAFGASQVVIKGMEMATVALGTWCIFITMRRHVSQRAAIWAAIMLPVFTLAAGGTTAANMLFQFAFVAAAFSAVIAATDAGSSLGRRLALALLAGLAIGCAGAVKQTAIFEAAAFFVALWIYGARGTRLGLAALYVVGAAVPIAAFVVYFVGAGAFEAMFNSVIVLSLERSGADVAASYGPELARYFTPLGILANAISSCGVLIFLVAAALFLVLRRDRVFAAVEPRIAVVAALWLAAAFAGILYGRVLVEYYVLSVVPPLVILAAIFFAHGLGVGSGRVRLALALSIVVGVACLAVLDRKNLFVADPLRVGSFDATRRVSAAILAEPPAAGDRLLVLNRGFAVYTETGLFPPGPYFHPTHMLGVFPTPSSDPLGEMLAANPRFIVVADPNKRRIIERASRYREALDYVGLHYRPLAKIAGAQDSFTVYEFVR